MREVTKAQYMKDLMSRYEGMYKRPWHASSAAIFFLGISMVMYFLVSANVINTSPEVQDYLLTTVFYDFSAHDLGQILLRTTGTTSSLQTLLFIYWGYYLCGAVLPAVILIWGIIAVRKFVPYEKGLIAIQQIREAVQDTPKTMSDEQKRLVRRAIRFGSFYENIVPLPNGWLKRPEYQWFSDFVNTPKAKTVIYTLPKIKYLLTSIGNYPKDLTPLLAGLDLLEQFYFRVAARAEKDKLKIIDVSKNGQTEVDILFEFAKKIRPMLLHIEQSKQSKRTMSSARQFVTAFVLGIWQSETVRQASNVSGIAAIIMFIGVVVFKIEITQAFLTWFTVTFGSLSISVGFSKSKRKNKFSR